MAVVVFLFLWSAYACRAQRREAIRWPLTLTTAWLVPSLKFLMRAILPPLVEGCVYLSHYTLTAVWLIIILTLAEID